MGYMREKTLDFRRVLRTLIRMQGNEVRVPPSRGLAETAARMRDSSVSRQAISGQSGDHESLPG
jgi:hypothetical protein